jgi:hypothetical protein
MLIVNGTKNADTIWIGPTASNSDWADVLINIAKVPAFSSTEIDSSLVFSGLGNDVVYANWPKPTTFYLEDENDTYYDLLRI